MIKAKWYNSTFFGIGWRLLSSYLMVMATILSLFGTGAYVFVTRSLYNQLDKKLLTLAQSAAYSFSEVEAGGTTYLNLINAVPWRDIFNRDQQSLEWFDAEGKLLGSKGDIKLDLPPTTGPKTVQQVEDLARVRTYTISVFRDSPEPNQPSLEGYIRANQSMEDLERVQSQLRWGLGMGGIFALGLVGLGGFWLTRRALEPIEQSFKQLKQFTADASHELRSPLTAIKASVEVMRNHPERIHPKDAKKLVAIASATAQMSSLTEDLLFLARTDASRFLRKSVGICLNTILQNSVELLEPLAEDKNIALVSKCKAKIFLDGNEGELGRLFSNLIENAIQYTPAGGKVSVTLSKQNRFAIVNVRDTGIGIAEENLPLVFDRFWRAELARSHREGGTGLGLAIAGAIAKRHGGKITVSSEVNVGSCFQVRLPRKTDSSACVNFKII